MELTKPIQKKGIQSRKVGDEWILYDSENETVHVINSTAEFVWSLCDGSNTLGDIERQLHDSFQVPEGTDVKKALDEIIQIFTKLGVIV